MSSYLKPPELSGLSEESLSFDVLPLQNSGDHAFSSNPFHVVVLGNVALDILETFFYLATNLAGMEISGGASSRISATGEDAGSSILS